MARPRPKKRARQDAPVQADFYEAEEREPDEEKFSGQRYDVRARQAVNFCAVLLLMTAAVCDCVTGA